MYRAHKSKAARLQRPCIAAKSTGAHAVVRSKDVDQTAKLSNMIGLQIASGSSLAELTLACGDGSLFSASLPTSFREGCDPETAGTTLRAAF